jgi:hypothetical protein
VPWSKQALSLGALIKPHALLEWSGSVLWVTDLYSANGSVLVSPIASGGHWSPYPWPRRNWLDRGVRQSIFFRARGTPAGDLMSGHS